MTTIAILAAVHVGGGGQAPVPPHVVSTSPAAGAVVPAGPLVLTVTFDRPMRPGSYSFVQASGDSYPDCGGAAPVQSQDGRSFRSAVGSRRGTPMRCGSTAASIAISPTATGYRPRPINCCSARSKDLSMGRQHGRIMIIGLALMLAPLPVRAADEPGAGFDVLRYDLALTPTSLRKRWRGVKTLFCDQRRRD
ncbi:Ig-like domain-containing protein [Sphingomonas sp. I4]